MFILDKDSGELLYGSKSHFCESCYKNNNSKCLLHYAKIKSLNEISIQTCPFGYCSVATNRLIFSGLKLKGKYNSKKVESKSRQKDNSTTFLEDDFCEFLELILKMENDLAIKDVYEQTIHDIKKANLSFNELLSEVIDSEEYKKDKNLRDLLDGLDFINTRLNYHDIALNKNNKVALGKARLDLVSIGVKISKMLSFKTEPRNIKIKNDHGTFSNISTLADSKLIFVLFFVLIENAIKYSKNNSIIYVTYYDYDLDNVGVEFKNLIETPLDLKDVNNLFRKGYRGSNVKSETGSGIGMTVVKNILDIYGYKFLLPKPNCNEYSFTIIFPKTTLNKKGGK